MALSMFFMRSTLSKGSMTEVTLTSSYSLAGYSSTSEVVIGLEGESVFIPWSRFPLVVRVMSLLKTGISFSGTVSIG